MLSQLQTSRESSLVSLAAFRSPASPARGATRIPTPRQSILQRLLAPGMRLIKPGQSSLFLLQRQLRRGKDMVVLPRQGTTIEPDVREFKSVMAIAVRIIGIYHRTLL